MEYQLLNNQINFNKEKNIGTVLYIVEGERREINLLGHIFKEVLDYKEVIGIDRNGRERIKYISKKNVYSKIFIINSEKSNIKSITNKEFIDEQIKVLKNYDEEISYEDNPIYYIFDCDRINDKENIKKLISMYGNAREPSKENEYDSIGGMMLLSYPSIESFIISNFEKDMYKFDKRFDFNIQSLKEYIGVNQYDNQKMSIQTLLNAFNELVKSLNKIEINQINLDDIRDFNANVFEYEQTYNNKYMLSLLLISFIDLGIIEFL